MVFLEHADATGYNRKACIKHGCKHLVLGFLQKNCGRRPYGVSKETYNICVWTGINRTMVHHWWKQWKLRDVTREVCVFTHGFFSIVCGNCILTYWFLTLQVTGSSSCVDGPPQATRRGQWYIEDQSTWYIVMIGLTFHFRLRMLTMLYIFIFLCSLSPPPIFFFWVNEQKEP